MPIGLRPNAGFAGRLQNQHARSTRAVSQSLERLSTGKRINRTSDDPSGFVAAEQLRGELTEIQSKLKSFSPRRLSLAQQSSTLSQFQDGLNDLRDRVVEASNGPIGQTERTSLQEQVDAAYESLEWISRELGDGPTPEVLQADRIDVTVDEATPVTISEGEAVEQAVSSVAFERARVGIAQRDLDREEELLREQEVIVTETLSLIEDTDFAEETANLAVSQTLTAAAGVALVYSRQAHAEQIGGLLDQVLEATPRDGE